MSKNWKVYFTQNGSLIDYEHGVNSPIEEGDPITYGWQREPVIVMEPNQLYFGNLVFSGTRRGRSAAVFELYNLDKPEQKLVMRMHEVCEMLKTHGCFVQYGKVSGVWKVVKQGQNYSLSFVQGPPHNDAIDFSDLGVRNGD